MHLNHSADIQVPYICETSVEYVWFRFRTLNYYTMLPCPIWRLDHACKS